LKQFNACIDEAQFGTLPDIFRGEESLVRGGASLGIGPGNLRSWMSTRISRFWPELIPIAAEVAVCSLPHYPSRQDWQGLGQGPLSSCGQEGLQQVAMLCALTSQPPWPP